MNYLRELMKDYKNEVKEILAADKTLATEIQVIFNEELFYSRHSMLI